MVAFSSSSSRSLTGPAIEPALLKLQALMLMVLLKPLAPLGRHVQVDEAEPFQQLLQRYWVSDHQFHRES
jgi:hypothetical protein